MNPNLTEPCCKMERDRKTAAAMNPDMLEAATHAGQLKIPAAATLQVEGSVCDLELRNTQGIPNGIRK